MNESLSERMRRGEQEFASTWGDSIKVGTTVSRVQRRRAMRAVTATAAAFAIVGTGAVGAVALWPSGGTSPADGVAAPASGSPAPSESASPAPDPVAESYPSSPEMVDGVPVLVPASQEVADNTLQPHSGPAFVPGERRALDQVVSQEAVASCADEWCGMAALPAVTSDVLKSGKLTAAVDEMGILNGGVNPLDTLRYVAVAGPEVGAYMAVDLSAWARDAGLDESWGVEDLAADDGGHTVAAVLQEYIYHGEGVDPSMVVLFDLDSGTSTVLAQGLDFASVEWDGTHWRVFGYGPEGTLGARVASDGQSWTVDDMQVARGWWLKEEGGLAQLAGQAWANRRLVVDGQAYPAQPDGTTYCDPAYEASASDGYVRMSCQVSDSISFDDPSLMHYFQLTAGEGWAPLDPALESQAPPASTSSGALGDGYVLWRGSAPVFLENGSETAIEAPNVEPLRGDFADGGLWMLGYNELGWLSPDLEYRQMMELGGNSVMAAVYPYGERTAS